MRVKINIELFDSTAMSTLEELGLTTKFLKVCYEEAFKQFLDSLCAEGLQRTLSVEIEDNTTK